MRSIAEHLERRKVWNKAFNSTSIKEYEPILKARVLQLVTELENRCITATAQGVELDLSQWLSYFTYCFR